VALERTRAWLRKRFPLAQPETAGIRVPGVLAPQTGQIVIPTIDKPELAPECRLVVSTTVSEDLAWHRTLLHPADLADVGTPDLVSDAFEQLLAPVAEDVPFGALLACPDILDVFTGISRPARAGKAYGQEVEAPRQRRIFEAEAVEAAQDRCRHGMIKGTCAICKREREKERNRQKRVRTIDVFDLLLPYLQPPIEPLLARPLLFPPGRRPFPFQVQGIQFLVEHQAALLGDEMGLGKTIQAIVALQVLFRQGKARRVLILCPRSVLGIWERELHKWAPELFLWRVRGTQADREAIWSSDAHVYLTTYATLRQDGSRGLPLKNKFNIVVLDEVQKIKNPSTKLTRATRGINAKYRWGLSGTPLENKVEDVVSIFDYLHPPMFKRNLSPSPYRVKRAIEPYFLRRRLADVRADLPKKLPREVWLDLTPEQRRAYDEAESNGRGRLTQPGVTRVHVFALINNLKQICNLDPGTGASCKLEYLEDQLEIIAENDQKALVFSHYPKVTLEKIQPELSSYDPALFDGRLSDSRREALLRGFQEESSPRVMLMSVRAGGLGITLTRANHVFHYDHWWNPAVAYQAEARAHRIGQTRDVFVYHMYAADTIEERIYDLLTQKQALFNSVIDDLSETEIKATFSDKDLFGLFGLEPPEQTRSGASGQGEAKEREPVRSDLSTLTPNEFEDLVAELYRKKGFTVSVTPRSHDAGVDVIARRWSDIGEQQLIIQCKHYPHGTVGAPDVQKLIGARADHPKAHRAILVTSGKFSAGAIKLAQRHRIDLLDHVCLGAELARCGLTPSR